MEKCPLISIIIPVYNVQDYLDECIESVINQSYFNLEIILVDDGSPDKSPIICEKWAQKDSRIIVIHKKNGGLSSARNAGLKIAKGKYISFIDSDDFITNNAIEIMFNRINSDDTIGIVSGLIYRYQDGICSTFKKEWDIKHEFIVPAKEFLLKAMDMSISYTVWNKLYRRDLLANVLFREGRNNEDVLFMYELGKEIKRKKYSMVNIPQYVYYYRLRPNSICTSQKRPIYIDTIQNLVEMIEDNKSSDKELSNILYKKYVDTLYYFLDSLLTNKVWYQIYFSKYQQMLKLVPSKFIVSSYHVNDAIYLILLKRSPKIRKLIKNIIFIIKHKKQIS